MYDTYLPISFEIDISTRIIEANYVNSTYFKQSFLNRLKSGRWCVHLIIAIDSHSHF